VEDAARQLFPAGACSRPIEVDGALAGGWRLWSTTAVSGSCRGLGAHGRAIAVILKRRFPIWARTACRASGIPRGRGLRDVLSGAFPWARQASEWAPGLSKRLRARAAAPQPLGTMWHVLKNIRLDRVTSSACFRRPARDCVVSISPSGTYLGRGLGVRDRRPPR